MTTDLERARTVAVTLEQENAALTARLAAYEPVDQATPPAPVDEPFAADNPFGWPPHMRGLMIIAAEQAAEARRSRPVVSPATRDGEPGEIDVLRARVGSALTWIDRYESKNGGLTIVLDNIKDSLTGAHCVDATPGATASSRFAAGELGVSL